MAIKIIKDKKIKKAVKTKDKKTTKSSAKKSVKKTSKSSFVKPISLAGVEKVPYGVRVIVKSKEKEDKEKTKKRNKKILRSFFMLVFVIGLAFSSVYAYNHLMTYLCSIERFFIDNIEITGCKNVTQSEIINSIPFKIGDSSFEVNLGQLEKELKETKPELKDVYAHRKNMFGKGKKTEIVVALTERLPEVFIYNKENKEGLDFDNKPFSLRGNMSTMEVPFLLYDNEQDRATLLSFYKKIKIYFSDLIPEIKEIKYGELEDVIITMNTGAQIYWGLPKENKIKEKAEKYFAIVKDLSGKKQNMEYIDLSFLDDNKDKIIVKLLKETEEVKK